MITSIIYKNLRFYWQKIILAISLISFLLFIALAAWLFSKHIKELANQPLNSLQTEIILQQDKLSKSASDIKTSGLIEPFNLQSFSKTKILDKLSSVSEIKDISSIITLWQFDPQNNKTVVGIDINDSQIGLRKIESWLMPNSKFFSTNNAKEVILERHFAKLFGHKLNTNYLIKGINHKIIGIVDFKEQSNLSNAQIFIPYNTALSLLDSDTAIVNQVYISLENASLLNKVQKNIENILPEYSVISKDRLLKNLSSFTALIYHFGNYFSLGILALASLLIFFILKMSRLEFAEQTKILKTIGWPQQKVRQWIFIESGYILSSALVLASILLIVFYQLIFPYLKIGSLLSQDFKL